MPGVIAPCARRGSFARAAVIATFALALGTAEAAAPRLVLDINTTPASVDSNPIPLGAIGSTFFFFADVYPNSGPTSLYKTDGTAAGTVLLKTLPNSGRFNPIAPPHFVVAGAKGYFVAYQASTGAELWVTDGTSAGTRMVIDVSPSTPPQSSSPRLLGVVGSELVFSAYVQTQRQQVFITDGSSAGTRPITPVLPSGLAPAQEMLVANGKIYIAFKDSALWVSDGTVAGAHVITDGTANNEPLEPRSLQHIGNSVLLITETTRGTEVAQIDTASDAVTFLEVAPGGASGVPNGTGALAAGNTFVMFPGGNGSDYELWRTDGTPGGTTRVADIAPGSASSISTEDGDFTAIGGRAVFVANDGQHGKQLWSSDGTAPGTVQLTSLATSPNTVVRTLGVRGTRAYFLAGIFPDLQVISTDGTSAGTHVLTELGVVSSNSTSQVTIAGDDTAVFFNVPNASAGPGQLPQRLYKYEPQANRVTFLADTDSTESMQRAAYANGLLLFQSAGPSTGREPWITDGTVAGTRILLNLIPDAATENSSPEERVALNGKLWFSADDGVHGRELWQSDGTGGGTRLAFDIRAGADSSAPKRLYGWKGELYFFATAASGASVLMRTDGGGSTLQTLAELSPAPATGELDSQYMVCEALAAVELNGKLYFPAKDPVAGVELWSTDGTAAGTQRVADANPGAGWSAPCGLTVFKGRVYFRGNAAGANVGSPARLLWASDGTESGTVPIIQTNPAGVGSGVVYTASVVGRVFNDELYFMHAPALDLSTSVWKTDGTFAGTQEAVGPATPGISLSPYGVVNGKLVVSRSRLISPGVREYEILAGDGTSAGMSSLLNGPLSSPPAVSILRNRIYLSVPDAMGTEPWVSDGTVSGTHVLKDINTAGDSNPSSFFEFNGTVYFLATDAAGARTLWSTDGTGAGTLLAEATSSVWRVLATTPIVAGPNAFFTGRESVAGIELFVFGNDGPIGANDTATAANGAAVAINVLANDADADGTLDASSVTIVSPPAHGSVTVSNNGTITYTPTAGYAGTDAFSYTVADNQGNVSSATTVTITVTQASTPPPGGGGGNGGGGGTGAGGGAGGSGGGGGGGGGPLSLWDALVLVALLGARQLARSVATSVGTSPGASGRASIRVSIRASTRASSAASPDASPGSTRHASLGSHRPERTISSVS